MEPSRGRGAPNNLLPKAIISVDFMDGSVLKTWFHDVSWNYSLVVLYSLVFRLLASGSNLSAHKGLHPTEAGRIYCKHEQVTHHTFTVLVKTHYSQWDLLLNKRRVPWATHSMLSMRL